MVTGRVAGIMERPMVRKVAEAAVRHMPDRFLGRVDLGNGIVGMGRLGAVKPGHMIAGGLTPEQTEKLEEIKARLGGIKDKLDDSLQKANAQYAFSRYLNSTSNIGKKISVLSLLSAPIASALSFGSMTLINHYAQQGESYSLEKRIGLALVAGVGLATGQAIFLLGIKIMAPQRFYNAVREIKPEVIASVLMNEATENRNGIHVNKLAQWINRKDPILAGQLSDAGLKIA